MFKAEGLSLRLEVDPQMRSPRRPRFSEDYLLVPLQDDGFLIVGGERNEILRGKSARVLLPRLLPLLDGSRTIDQIQSELPGIRRQVLDDAIALLYMRGLLEEGEREGDRAAFSAAELERHEEQLSFFSRYTDVTRVSPNRYATQRRLRDANVLIIAPESAGIRMARDLSASGVGRLSRLSLRTACSSQKLSGDHHTSGAPSPPRDLEDGKGLTAAVRDRTLVVAMADASATPDWSMVDAVCRAEGVSWLRVCLDDDFVEIGPRFSPQETACWRCAEWSLRSDDEPLRSTKPLARASGESLARLMVVMEISGLFIPLMSDRVRRLDFRSWRVEERTTIRLPRCPVCGSPDSDGTRLRLPEDLPALFHLQTNHKWTTMAPKSHQVHYSAHVTELSQGSYKQYPTFPKVDLPALEELPTLQTPLESLLRRTPPDARVPRVSLDIEDVARICGWSARWRSKSFPYRFTPSGGGLCSSDLYLLSWSVTGLPPGAYHYQGRDHRLESLREGDPRPALRAALSGTQEFEGARMAVVQTAHMMRLQSKYGARAYRYAHLDAGVMSQSLVLIGRALGLRLWVLDAFDDDRMSDFLGLPGFGEFATRVVLIGCEKSDEN